MKWFVYVAAEYYAEAHIIEADTPDEAANLAISQTHGATYARYDDEGTPSQRGMYRDGEATPACAVAPLDTVTLVGSQNRVEALRARADGTNDPWA